MRGMSGPVIRAGEGPRLPCSGCRGESYRPPLLLFSTSPSLSAWAGRACGVGGRSSRWCCACAATRRAADALLFCPRPYSIVSGLPGGDGCTYTVRPDFVTAYARSFRPGVSTPFGQTDAHFRRASLDRIMANIHLICQGFESILENICLPRPVSGGDPGSGEEERGRGRKG